MFGRKKKTLMGLDIGSRTVKAIDMTASGDTYVVTGYAFSQVEVASDGNSDAQALQNALASGLRNGSVRSKRCVSAVSGRSVIVRYIPIARMSDENLRNTIRFEADKYFPFEIDEMILDCQKLADPPGQEESSEMKVVLVGAKRSLIEEHIAIVRSAGLIPKILDVDSFAVGNAFELNEHLSPRPEEEGRVVALIDIGAAKTNINIMIGTTSYFTRELYIGGNNFTKMIARRFDIEDSEAERIKNNPQDRLEEIRETVSPVISELANDIVLSCDFFENQFDREVQDVFLSGGGSRLAGLVEELERILERRTRTWDPTENLRIDLPPDKADELRENASHFAIAIGLASRLRG